MSLKWSSATDQLYAVSNSSPSLDLDFAANKTLDDNISGNNLVTFSRDLRTGTYFGSDGLIKNSPVNLYYPSVPTAAHWSVPAGWTETDNYGTAPDGTNSSFRISSTSSGFAQDTANVVAGTTYTYSVYIKLEVSRTSTFNIAAQGAALSAAILVNVLPELVVGQWVRVSLSFTADTTGTVTLRLMSGTNADAEFWGVQLEEGSTPTTYIPTTTTISGAPRFDHDPVTGESLGLLIEESRTNLYETSVDFGPWSKSATYWSITSNSTSAPDGTNTATKCIPNAGINNESIYNGTALTGGVTYTGSIFFKAGELSKVRLRSAAQSNSPSVLVDLTAGTATPNSCTSTIQSLTDGWHRVTMTWTQGSTVATGKSGFGVESSSGETFNGTNGFYAWGAQIEARPFPTSYIPTAGSAVTRAADIATIEGTNFSSWYNANIGSLYIESNLRVGGATRYLYDGRDGGNANAITLNTDSIGRHVVSLKDSTGVDVKAFSLSPTPPAQSGFVSSKHVFAYSSGDSNSALNGSIVVPSINESFTRSGPSSINLGRSINGTSMINGYISRLSYFPYRLSDTILQEITS